MLLINTPVAATFNTTTTPNFLLCSTTRIGLDSLDCFGASTHFLLFTDLCQLYSVKNCQTNLYF
jgi:hypothetical protein